MSAEVTHNAGLALADLNGDGQLDIVREDQTYVLGANGALPESPTHNQHFMHRSVLADLDGDGRLEGIRRGWEWPSEVFDVASDGSFYGFRPLSGDALKTEVLAVGDVDRDGSLDVVAGFSADLSMGESPESVRVYFNDGEGFFGPGDLLGDTPYSTLGLALGDMDLSLIHI